MKPYAHVFFQELNSLGFCHLGLGTGWSSHAYMCDVGARRPLLRVAVVASAWLIEKTLLSPQNGLVQV